MLECLCIKYNQWTHLFAPLVTFLVATYASTWMSWPRDPIYIITVICRQIA